jgi:UDP-glucose 4-epimerase
MRVVVTGGAGYIGSVCVEHLLDAGHTVTVIDNLSEGHRAAVDGRATFVEADLEDRNAVRSCLGSARAHVVLHFAASALVGESMRNPGRYFLNNVANGARLLDAALEAGVGKIVFSSTCATYGVPDQVPIDETAPQRPANPYGESKLMFERMLHWYHELHGMDYVALRYFNAAGASERFGEHHRVETHLIPNALKVVLGEKPSFDLFGDDYPTPDGTCVRDYVHVADLAQAHIRAMESGRSGCYNLGNGCGSSVREVLRACETITGQRIDVRVHPRRPGDPPRLVASTGKAQRELGWKPRFSGLEQIVETAWSWHRRNPRGYPAD